MDKKIIISIVVITLFSMAMPYRGAQAAEQNVGAVSPAASTSDTNSSASGDSKSSEPVANLAEGKEVQEALEQLIHAYETGNIGVIQSNIDPTMMGYQRFLDGIRQDAISLRQVRVELLNTQVVVGPDVAVIQTDWEKRFLSASSLSPGLFTGHSIFLMHRSNAGWRMAAFSGDNLFAGQGGTLGQITTVPVVLTLTGAVAAPSGTLQITVVDPDLANRSSLTVQVTAAQGDRESIFLTATTPGRFTGSLTVINQSTFTAGNGTIEVQSTPTTISIHYLDNNPGNNRPPSMLTKNVQVN